MSDMIPDDQGRYQQKAELTLPAGSEIIITINSQQVFGSPLTVPSGYVFNGKLALSGTIKEV